MLTATMRYPTSNLTFQPLFIDQKFDFSLVHKITQSAKFIKLRPKSQSEIYNNLSINLQAKKVQNTIYSPKDQVQHKHQSFIMTKQRNFWEKQTKETSIQKSLKEQLQIKKNDTLLDTRTQSTTLKPLLTKQQKGAHKRREVIKLKRPKKEYSPINKLIELQIKQKKDRISLQINQVRLK